MSGVPLLNTEKKQGPEQKSGASSVETSTRETCFRRTRTSGGRKVVELLAVPL